MALIDRMRDGRKSPSVLRLRVLRAKGENPDLRVFIFEGPDDVPVYEEWIRRIDPNLEYEPVAGNGKQQLLAFLNSLDKQADDGKTLENVYLFIDRDFDPPSAPHEYLYELEAYSIENLLCCLPVLDSILVDEYRMAGEIDERRKIKDAFSQVISCFHTTSSPIDFLLFAAQRTGRRVEKKPEKCTEIANIYLTHSEAAYTHCSDVCELDSVICTEELQSLREVFDNLSPCLKHRGKYVLDFFRRWLRALGDDRQCPNPKLFAEAGALRGDPSSSNLRRFASCSPIPSNLAQFVHGISHV